MSDRPTLSLALGRWGTLAGLLVLLLAFTLARPDAFPTANNLRNIVEQAATLAMVATTVTLVMVTGDFDLSVGALASLCGVVAARVMVAQEDTVALIGPGIAAALAVGALGGALNGVLVAYAGVSAFVATLATMTAFGGLALLVTDGATIFSGIPPGFKVIGQGALGPIPIPILIMLVVAGVAWLVLEHTPFGRYLYAIGGNAQAANASGVDVPRARFIAFVLSGLGAALAAVVLTSRLASAHPTAGHPFMLNAAAAVFLGMTSFRNGEAHVPGTLLGVLIMGVLGNGLNIIGVNSYIQSVLTGALILAAVMLSGLSRRRGH